MELRKGLIDVADKYYDSIAVNDFSSFILSDFKNDVLLDLSAERADENVNLSKTFLSDITQMQDTGLSDDESVIVESLVDFAEYIKKSSEYHWYKFNVTHNTCPLKYVIKRLETFPLGSDSDSTDGLERYIRLLSQMPEVISAMVVKLKKQYDMGFSIHPEEIKISKDMLLSFKQTEHSLLDPENRGIVSSAAGKLTVRLAISEMNLQLDNLVDCLEIFKSREFKSLSHIKGGEEYYKSLIKTYTSYDLTPQEIHEIGLHELEVTKSKILELIRAMGLNISPDDFKNMVLADRRFYDNTAEELSERFARALDKIRPKLPSVFNRIPKADCCSIALGKTEESATSWGYYSVPIGTEKRGIFYFSAAELDKRTQIRTAAITYHELLPGHHFQVNIAKEDKTLPKISQNHFNTAFADGWAEYASDLANELSMYDAYELYGRYLWDIILCVRLIVDTGVNALGWDIGTVRRFMAENTILSELEIKMESLRYSVDMPGQALAYKMGSIKNRQLRIMAESELKGLFDIKEYHDIVLKYGSIPLYLLEKNVKKHIADKKRAGFRA